MQDYKISLKFNDGKEQTVDFAGFIKNTRHQDIKKYQNIDEFKKFHLTFGDLEWNDYELAFPIYDLYQGKVSH